MTMADVMDEFYDGPHATPPPVSEGPVYLGIKNMTEDGHLDLTDVRHISESDYPTWTRRVEPRPGDVIFTYEASLHRYAIIPDGFRGTLGRRVALLRPRTDLVDTRFLLYLFIGPEWRNTVLSRVNVGSTVDRLPLTDFPRFPVRLPPIWQQRKITAVLSAYDDLIENNTRRIRILEEMVQRLYGEWFVDFRYPGHEDMPLVESELGLIPANWSIDRVADHAQVIRGRSYRSVDMANDGGVPFFNLKCIARDGGFRPEGIKRYTGEFKESHRASTGDILMAVTDMTQERRIVARAARVPDIREEFGVFSMDLVKIVPKDLPGEYVLGMLQHSTFPDHVKAHANGANVLHLHPDRIREYRVAVPVPAVTRQYADQVGPTQHMADRLEAATGQLRAARDLLLPRLISGEINVDDLDVVASEIAA
jgi:type I restriction enzyme S subunit